MAKYSTWEEVKAQIRAVDPRSDAEREAGREAARARHEAYVRGYQLSEMRKAAQLTQAELAERLGVTQARVSKIESGDVSGIDIVRGYVNALGGEVVLTATLGDKTWKVV
ncbi:helix-turn-helix domain-containing protein [Glycomyces arizonensis]|uniref:helix-turn-helix domain-containing protein n=1 Tax=Glycomyces arizonensis TaxID=256035 RepID=UPI00047D3C22|nr:helix-turn-helix domain-containing protein [Glycomyces arizonensis]